MEDYRDAIIEHHQRVQRRQKTLNLSRLAKNCSINLSYFSNVLKKRGHFNADQIYIIAKSLELSPTEYQILEKLMQHHRCELKSRKLELALEINSLKKKLLKSDTHLENVQDFKRASELRKQYFLDPMNLLFHLTLGIDQYAKDPNRAGKLLNLSSSEITKKLSLFRELQLLTENKTQIEVKQSTLHLDDDDVICKAHQALVKLKSLEKLSQLAPEKKKSMMISFSSNEENYKKIIEAFYSFIKKAQKIVEASPKEKIYQLNFDLFSWLD